MEMEAYDHQFKANWQARQREMEVEALSKNRRHLRRVEANVVEMHSARARQQEEQVRGGGDEG
jgi:hypothetical protein